MSHTGIRVEPLTPTIGAVVEGVDLTQEMDDETFAAVTQAWMDHLVLFFRDQPLHPEQHLALGRRFGELHIHPAAPYAGGNPELMIIHADADSQRVNGERWHSDVSADEEPPMGSILHLQQVPSRGGDTCWANMYEAYEALSPAMQAFLDPLTAQHVANYAGYYGDHQPQRPPPRAVHPVVRTHPVTGRKALYVNEGFTRAHRRAVAAREPGLPGLPVRPRAGRELPVPLPVGGELRRDVGQPLHAAHGGLGLPPGDAQRHPRDDQRRPPIPLERRAGAGPQAGFLRLGCSDGGAGAAPHDEHVAGAAAGRDRAAGQHRGGHEAQPLKDDARRGLAAGHARLDLGQAQPFGDPQALARQDGAQAAPAHLRRDDELDVGRGGLVIAAAGRGIGVQMREADDRAAPFRHDGHRPEGVGVGDPVDREAVLGEVGAREEQVVAGQPRDEVVDGGAILRLGEPQRGALALPVAIPQRDPAGIAPQGIERGAGVGGRGDGGPPASAGPRARRPWARREAAG